MDNIVEWEYETDRGEMHEIPRILKSRGDDGWELCSAIQINKYDIMFFFKRPKTSKT